MTDLGEALLATDPHPSLGEHARVFDRFVGSWDCDYTNLAEDGSVRSRYPGRVTFGWILGGRAMQDVWSGGPDPDRPSMGTSIRYVDVPSGEWIVTWLMPEAGVATTVKGGPVGDSSIELYGEDDDGSLRRWSFNDIRTDRFVWRGERSVDRGQTWRVEAEYHMTRRT
jgi:hypothetical protein